MATTGKLSGIEDALHYRLNALGLSAPIAWPGAAFQPVVGQTYVAPSILPNRTDYAAVGSNSPRRHRGLYQVIIYSPINEGSLPAAEIADQIIEQFAGVTIDKNSLRVRIGSFDGSPALPYRGTSLDQDGWRLTPVTIPWWCDTFS